jgi:hypothetical protein
MLVDRAVIDHQDKVADFYEYLPLPPLSTVFRMETPVSRSPHAAVITLLLQRGEEASS